MLIDKRAPRCFQEENECLLYKKDRTIILENNFIQGEGCLILFHLLDINENGNYTYLFILNDML